MIDEFSSPDELHILKETIDNWLQGRVNENFVIQSADYDEEENRWYAFSKIGSTVSSCSQELGRVH